MKAPKKSQSIYREMLYAGPCMTMPVLAGTTPKTSSTRLVVLLTPEYAARYPRWSYWQVLAPSRSVQARRCPQAQEQYGAQSYSVDRNAVVCDMFICRATRKDNRKVSNQDRRNICIEFLSIEKQSFVSERIAHQSFATSVKFSKPSCFSSQLFRCNPLA